VDSSTGDPFFSLKIVLLLSRNHPASYLFSDLSLSEVMQMTNKFFKFFVDIFSSPTSSSNGKRALMDKLGEVIHADLLCINESDREEILSQVGISLEAFTQGFQVESFSNLWSIELLIINKLNRADLVARLWTIRKKFHSQVGDDVYRAYVSSLADELTEEKIKALIAKEFNEQASIPKADQKGSVRCRLYKAGRSHSQATLLILPDKVNGLVITNYCDWTASIRLRESFCSCCFL